MQIPTRNRGQEQLAELCGEGPTSQKLHVFVKQLGTERSKLLTERTKEQDNKGKQLAKALEASKKIADHASKLKGELTQSQQLALKLIKAKQQPTIHGLDHKARLAIQKVVDWEFVPGACSPQDASRVTK